MDYWRGRKISTPSNGCSRCTPATHIQYICNMENVEGERGAGNGHAKEPDKSNINNNNKRKGGWSVF